jgi:hypothetical protein
VLKWLLGALSVLVILAGLATFALTKGGPLNRIQTGWPDDLWRGDFLSEEVGIGIGLPGPVAGLSLAALGGAGLVLARCWRPGEQPPLAGWRLVKGYSLYALILGVFFLWWTPGGMFNTLRYFDNWYVDLGRPGPVAGWCLLGVGLVGYLCACSWHMPRRERTA